MHRSRAREDAAELVARDPPRRREPADELRLLDREDVQGEVEVEQAARLGVAREVARAGVRLVGRRDGADAPDERDPRGGARVSVARRGIVDEERRARIGREVPRVLRERGEEQDRLPGGGEPERRERGERRATVALGERPEDADALLREEIAREPGAPRRLHARLRALLAPRRLLLVAHGAPLLVVPRSSRRRGAAHRTRLGSLARWAPAQPAPAPYSATSPSRAAFTMAAARLSAPSFARIAFTWNLAVCSEMPSRAAIALFESPSASRPSTSVSRAVSPSAGVPSGGRTQPSARVASSTASPRASAASATTGDVPCASRPSALPIAPRSHRVAAGARADASAAAPAGSASPATATSARLASRAARPARASGSSETMRMRSGSTGRI